eukprot:SAG31_NODE_2210_length_6179_cov_78.720230_7_plen_205_part_00
MLVSSARLAVEALQLHDLPSAMGRKLLLAKLRPSRGGGEAFMVGTVHLESLDNAATRALQLRAIWAALASGGSCESRADEASQIHPAGAVLCGDMNYDPADGVEEAAAMPDGAVDCWLEVHGAGVPGFTMPIDDVTQKPTRIDRFFSLCNGDRGMQPISMQVIGTDGIGVNVPADGESKHVDGIERPSDHYGLACTLHIADTQT